MHADAVAAHKALQNAIQQQASRTQRLQSLRTALLQEQARIDAAHQELRVRYSNFVDDATWEQLRAKVDPGALAAVETLGNAARDDEQKLREHGKSQGSVVAAGLKVLADRVEAARTTLGEDETKSKRRAERVKKLEAARTTEAKAKTTLTDAEGANERITATRHSPDTRLTDDCCRRAAVRSRP